MKKNHKICYRLNAILNEYRNKLYLKIKKDIHPIPIKRSQVSRAFFAVLHDDKVLEELFLAKIVTYIKKHCGGKRY